MGDFNEVRLKSERFGSVFNAQGADMFNAFIASTSLEEVPLGDLDGFNKFVTDTWNLAHVDDSNAMRNVMNKLKFLKRNIQEWLNDNMNKSKSVSGQFKEELQKLDVDIDKGIGSDDIVNKRLEVFVTPRQGGSTR
ncbi:hypothetical protein Tco_0902398 [Tanacetum coccineum]